MSSFCFNGAAQLTATEGVTNVAFDTWLNITTPGYAGAVTYTIASVTVYDVTCPVTTSYFTYNSGSKKMQIGSTALDYSKCPNGVSLVLRAIRTADTTLNASCTISVDINQVIKTPVITDCSPRSVTERSTVGTVFGSTLKATTTNVGTSLLWSLSTSPTVAVSACDGQLRVAQYFLWKTASSYTVTATVVNDGSALGIGTASASCSLTINVIQAPLPPVPSVTSFTMPELSAVGAYVGNVKSVDPDGFAIKNHTWTVTDTPHAFLIDAQGNITVRQVVDTITSLKSVFTYTMNVSNAYTSARYTVTISLTPVPRPPTVSDQVRSVREDIVALTKLTPALNASHPQNLNFTFALTPTTTFDVYPNGTVFLKAGQTLDYNIQSAYVITIVVTDYLGASSNALLTISLIEANKQPKWYNGISNWSFTVDEGSLAGTVLLGSPTIQATDPNTRDALTYSLGGCYPTQNKIPFEIDPVTGAVSVATGVSAGWLYNETSVYIVASQTFYCNMTVKDNGIPSMSANGTMYVKITNIAPRLLLGGSNYTVAGNAAIGTTITNIAPLMWTPYSPATVVYSFDSVDTTAEGDSTFLINPTTGAITVANASYGANQYGPPRWNYNTRKRFAVTVRVTDTVRSRGSAANYFINMTHVNRAPTWSPIPKMSAPSRLPGNIGTALSLYATDLDSTIVAENLTYSIVAGNTQNTFAVRSTDGQIYVNNASAPYFVYIVGAPYPPTYNLTVRVCDAGVDGPSYCTNANMTIEVTQTNFPQ
jgi:hypothetical protein